MPIFEYGCPRCALLSEKLVMPGKPIPAEIECPRCKTLAPKRDFPSRVALSRSGMDNPPVDNFIGRDADRRWTDIQHRQEIRDKVRVETGQVGLSMVGRNTFKPVTPTQKELRTSLSETISATGGFKNSDPVPGS